VAAVYTIKSSDGTAVAVLDLAKQRPAIKAFRQWCTTQDPHGHYELELSGWGDREPSTVAHHPDRRLSTKPPRDTVARGRYVDGSVTRRVIIAPAKWGKLQRYCSACGVSATSVVSAAAERAIDALPDVAI